MFCIKCGANNSDEAAFCQKCGNRFEAEEETRVAARPRTDLAAADDERIFSITPTLKFVKVGYAAAIAGAFFLALLVGVLAAFTATSTVVLGLIAALVLVLVPAFFHLKKKMVRYTLTDTMIEIDRGLISRSTQNIPLRRVQDVTVTATIAQRLLGFGDIRIDNASEDAGKIILDDIDSPKKYAEMILRQMRHLDR